MADDVADGAWLDLSDAVGLLRDQLASAQRAADGSDIRFRVGEVTVEFAVQLTRTTGGGGALRFGVVGADGKREHANSTTHRLQITLHPRSGGAGGGAAGGGDLEIGDTDWA
ncbi:trypco2 family protein [Streptomyces sp. NPDC059875]|uniref:trypco2 family protein n=1 Tax=unclassified Streptomyces TaxID=2593676 RepID=UPI0036673010